MVAQEIRKANIARQVTIQSFDWGSLMRMRQVMPKLPLVALTNYDFLQVGQPGKSPWLGGIDIDDFGGDLVKATKSFGAAAISPVHGFPQDGKVTDPTYKPYVTAEMVKSAHRAGMKVIPWTVDDPATMQSLIDKGVDGIISDYPDRVRDVARANHFKLPKSYDAPAVRALPSAHAHNDYDHRRPLQDALDRGFNSVEADVWLIDGELRVAHDLADAKPGRTLESLYLKPLADRVRENHGQVYRRGGGFQLLIDIKSDGPSTYAAVDKALAKYRGISTIFVDGRVFTGAVTSVISGNRPLDDMKAQKLRYAGYDGRLADLPSGMPHVLDAARQRQLDERVHLAGRRSDAREREDQAARHRGQRPPRLLQGPLLGHPDVPGAAREALWRELVAANVDYINTDDLHGLEDFLRG